MFEKIKGTHVKWLVCFGLAVVIIGAYSVTLVMPVSMEEPTKRFYDDVEKLKAGDYVYDACIIQTENYDQDRSVLYLGCSPV